MDNIKRMLNVGKKGDPIFRREFLVIHFPILAVDAEWFCEWSIGYIHPRKARVYGKDQIEAFYNCLNFIEEFIKNMQKQGYEIWRDQQGDLGGFEFKHTVE